MPFSLQFYHRQLYSSAPNIHQIGVPVEISRRDIDVNTDEITTSNKEVSSTHSSVRQCCSDVYASVVDLPSHDTGAICIW